MTALRVVFMGTAEVSAVTLRALLDAPATARVVGVVTPPDRPRGRRRQRSPCEVKTLALEAGLPVIDPPRINTDEALAQLHHWQPEVIIAVAYGQILGPSILDLPPLGCLNVHLSCLPALRGAAPVQWAILRGLDESGVTLMRMDRGMDSGEILAQRRVRIDDADTAGALQARLATLGAALLVEKLPDWQAGRLQPQPQDPSRATLAPKLDKAQGEADWMRPADELARCVRAFNPWPGFYTQVPASGNLPAHRLTVHAARAEDTAPADAPPPGTLLPPDAEGNPRVATGHGALRLLEVQPEGRRRMSGADYLRGRPLATHLRLMGRERKDSYANPDG